MEMNTLAEIIKSEIEIKGRLTFSEYMEKALYHPGLGYYTSGETRIGKRGDYYTSPSVDPAFGEVLAGFIAKSGGLIDEPRLRVIEFGGGIGTLASDILDSLARNHPESYEKTDYMIIEKGDMGPGAADGALYKHGPKIKFESSLTELDPGRAGGVILSNEFLDALPFHRVRFTGGALKEVFVTLVGGEFEEIIDEPSTPGLGEYFNGYETCFREGQETEVNLNAGRWLSQAQELIGKGFILTIDYGFLASELFSPERMKGTYKCMHKHTIGENPYINIGRQDITAHVDFSNLIRVGGPLGLEAIKYTTQCQFLIDWGVLDIMTIQSGQDSSSEQEAHGRNTAIKNLFLPGSMGNSFKVLLQAKNLDVTGQGFYPESPLKLSFGIL
ncbi:MAG TPA: SAM-dependent methyltransferase [Thermodesulfobacteriota bacterium]|nr:SAM-dependent methyltransferase [Thermodesulfobacteriota bacterium]